MSVKNNQIEIPVGQAACSSKNPCYCYGDICLLPEVKGECHKGKVYRSGKPVCSNIWEKLGGKVTCTALGFYNVVSTAKKSTR